MANYLTSSDFTFVHPSATGGYNVDFHTQQNIFSPINCTLPTTIQFPTPSVTSSSLGSLGHGTYQPDLSAVNTLAFNYSTLQTYASGQILYNQSPLFNWPDVSSSSIQPSPLVQVPKSMSQASATGSSWLNKINDERLQIRCKRKAEDLPENICIPAKIHINEERMSACMNDLHLDNNNVGCQENFENEPWYSQHVKTDASVVEMNEIENSDSMPTMRDSAPSLKELNAKLGLNKNLTIELCHELEFGLKTKEILPKMILDEMVKSSMQVVVWKPPEVIVNKVIKNLAQVNDSLESTSDDNVNENDMSNVKPSSSMNDPSETCRNSQDLTLWPVKPDGHAASCAFVSDTLDDCLEDMEL